MPTTRVNAQQLGPVPAAALFAAVDLVNGNNYLPQAGRILVFRNASATVPSDVSIITPGTVDGNPVGDRTFTVPVSSTVYEALGEAHAYRTQGTGEVEFTATAAVDVAVLQG